MVDQSRTTDALVIANKLRPTLLRLNRYLRNEAHDLGVTNIQASLLGSIQRMQSIGLGELAAQEHMSAPTLVNHIDKLEAAGYVERARNNPQDRRRVELYITEKGSQILLKLREKRTAWLTERLQALSEEERALIAAALEPLQALVRQEI